MNNDLTHLDLFSGISGFAIAAQRAGFRTVGFSELEPYACAALAARWPGIPNLGDVRGLRRASCADEILVLTGGCPCQPASLIGERLGTEDARWLWPEAIRCLGEFRPKYALFENPPAILSLESGRAFAGVLGGMAALGYNVFWECLPAAAFGAGHRRERVWIFAADAYRTGLEGQSGDGAAIGGPESHRPIATPNLRDRKLTSRGWYHQSGIEPVVDGIPGWLVRLQLHAIGNALVPAVAEPFFHWIRQLESTEIIP